MPSLLHLQTIEEDRGYITVIEKVLPFPVKRVFYIYNVPEGLKRGGHRHRQTRVALVAVSGACIVSGARGAWSYRLDKPSMCLLLEPEDWHEMLFDVPGTVLLCLASEYFDPDDYIDDPFESA